MIHIIGPSIFLSVEKNAVVCPKKPFSDTSFKPHPGNCTRVLLLWELAVEKILIPIARSLGSYIYRILQRRVRREFSVSEITESLENGKLSFDKTFTISGTFSEYVPFVDMTTLIGTSSKSETTSSCRLGDIVRDGTYLGALFPLEAERATEPAIPLIYSSTDKSRKVFSFSTGDQLKLECQLVPLDYSFRGILYNKECFCSKEKPFGLKITDVYTKRPQKADKFVIDAFFLTSLRYNAGVENLFSSLMEIAETWIRETGGYTSIFVGLMLHFLSREDVLDARAVDEESGRLIAHYGWVGRELCRFSRPVDILDSAGSRKEIEDMMNHIFDFTFIEGEEQLRDWAGMKTLLEGNFEPDQKKILSQAKELGKVAEQLSHRGDLLKAWNFYLQPELGIDFQFDQVSPVVKQTIEPRKILKERGLI